MLQTQICASTVKRKHINQGSVSYADQSDAYKTLFFFLYEYSIQETYIHFLNNNTRTGASGRFNISNLQQTQLSDGNPEAKDWIVSYSYLRTNMNGIHILA